MIQKTTNRVAHIIYFVVSLVWILFSAWLTDKLFIETPLLNAGVYVFMIMPVYVFWNRVVGYLTIILILHKDDV